MSDELPVYNDGTWVFGDDDLDDTFYCTYSADGGEMCDRDDARSVRQREETWDSDALCPVHAHLVVDAQFERDMDIDIWLLS
jgi:hypothetical protein